MSTVTLEGIAALLEHELRPINSRLTAIETVQAQHTSALVNISTDVKSLLDHKTLTDHRVERIEQWATEVGHKVGIKLNL